MDNEEQVYGDDFDPQEHLGCFVFTPEEDDTSRNDRPTKRRRTSKQKNRDLEARNGKATKSRKEENCPFPVLLNGQEKEEVVRLRWQAYQRLWKEQEERTNTILASFNTKTLDDVSEFLNNAAPENYDGKIPTAIILAGPNIASHGPLFTQLAERIRSRDRTGPVVVLNSKDAPNLKGALKKLIKDATQQEEGVDDEEDTAHVGRRGTKLLNYDLQIIQKWCQLHEGQKVTIAIQDTEAFDTNILSDLISLLSAYLDRIPFVLLLGIATSVEIFHDKLPKATIRLMQGDKFDVERAEECLAQIFNDAVVGDKSMLRLGATLCDFLLERQRDHTQSIQGFLAALKYAYMSHFYANPLSIILGYFEDPEQLNSVLSKAHIDAIRTLPSFRKYIEAKLGEKETAEVRALLINDDHLRTIIATAATECQSHAVRISQALAVLEIARSCLGSQNRTPRYELYTKAISGELEKSPTVRALLLSLRKMNSGSLLTLLDKLEAETDIPSLAEKLEPLREGISGMVIESESSGKKNLTSEFDVTSNDALRGTAVSKKVRLNQQKSTLTKQDAEYSKLVQMVHDVMEEFLGENLKGLQNVFLHEVFFYDLISPHRDVFAPRSRATIERGLSQPQDYLACECCAPDDDEDETGIKPTQPPTSIIYQLYLESGALVNLFDLWSAFYSVIGGEDGEYCDEQTAQALFYRGLAEMKFMGFVKHTKKKTDHLAKLAWKGL
ncbi:Origin recognition complex subunit 3 [Rhizina undulata]